MIASALVIGASSGIGQALAIRLARSGAKVALVARRADRLESVRQACDAAAGRPVASIHVHDVAVTAAVPDLYNQIVAASGGLDLVVYCAGHLPKIEKDEYDFAKDGPILQIGLLGAVAWLNEAARDFAARRQGRICGISSIAGDRGRRAYPAYHAAKAGLSTYLESLRNRLAPFGVKVCTIKPGFVDSDMTKGMPGLFWLISPDQAAATILKHIEKGSQQAYVPARWGLVSLIIRSIPSFIFRRLDI